MAAPAREPIPGNMSAIYLLGSGHDELRTVFDKLAKGANQDGFQDLHDMPFGTYGQFYDQYGVQWIFRGDRLT
jgi:PhnB protein